MRAEETRALAGEMKGAEHQAIMLGIAGCYDRLAELAEKDISDSEIFRRGDQVADTQ
jgi:hypothetical protein